jgi:methanogenic corrinoid protein MtbC1
MDELIGELETTGSISSLAVNHYAAAFPRIISVVEEKLAIDLDSGKRKGVSEASRDHDFIRSVSEHFGRSLEAVYRYGLWKGLVSEAIAMASGLASRQIGRRSTYIMQAWVLAITSAVRSPEVYELINPLEVLRGRIEEIARESSLDKEEHEVREDPFVDALLENRAGDALEIIRGDLIRKGSLESTLEHYLYGALVEIGRRWQRNVIGVAEEHAATAALRKVSISFLDSVDHLPERVPYIASSCVPGDEHELGAEILSGYLSTRGWRIYFIGHSLPEDEIVWEIGRRDYSALLLSVSMIRHLPAMERLVSRLRERFPGLLIIAGGAALAAAPGIIGQLVDLTAGSLKEVNTLLEGLETGDA